MARALNGTTQYLNNESLTISPPCALVAWGYSTDDTSDNTAVSIANAAPGAIQLIRLDWRGDVGGDPLRAILRDDAAALPFADTTTGFSINTWHHGVAIFASSGDIRALIDGGSKGTTATAFGAITLTRTAIGAYVNADTPNVSANFAGRIAEAALYDLSAYPGATDSDRADNFESNVVPALALGYSPLFFPLGLAAYWPLIGRLSPEPDWVGGHDMTLVAGPTAGVHPPRVSYPVPDMSFLAQEAITYPLVQIQGDSGLMATASTVGSTARAIAYSEER